jgi:hypothetical protein
LFPPGGHFRNVSGIPGIARQPDTLRGRQSACRVGYNLNKSAFH